MNARLRLLAVAALLPALAGCTSTGLDPFPRDLAPGHGPRFGLDPFPDRALNPVPTRRVGLDPFPDTVTRDSGRRLGLDPFPGGPKAAPLPGSIEQAPPPKVVKVVAATPVAPLPPTPPPPPPPPPPRLALKFEKGATRDYRMAMDMVMRSPMFGEDGLVMKMGMEMKQTVEEVTPEGNGVVASNIAAMTLEMANPFIGTIKMDSRDEASIKAVEENPMMGQLAGLVRGMVGRSVRITQSPTGKVVDTAGLDELMGGMGGPGGMMGGDLGSQMSGMPAPFPEQPLFEGMSWPFEQVQVSPMGTITTSGTMKVSSFDAARGMAVVAIEGTMTHEPAEDVDEGDMQAQMAAMIKLKDGKMTGTLDFDVRRGVMVRSLTTASMTMENPMLGGEMSTEVKADLSLVE